VGGDLVDALVGGLEHFLRPVDPLGEQPLQRGRAGDRVEVAGQGAHAHVRPPRQLGHAERLVEPVEYPGQQLAQVVVARGGRRSGHGGGDELGLAAGAVRGHHEPPRQRVGHRRTVIDAHEVQAQVEAGRLARRGVDAAVLQVEHLRVDLDQWVPRGQQPGVQPVRGGPPTVQQPGGGQHERPGADGDDPRAALVGRAHRVDELGRLALVHVAAARHDHRVGGDERVQPVRRVGAEPAADPRPLRTADREVVPRVGQVGPVHTEDLARGRHLDQRDPVGDRQCHGRHGRKCTAIRASVR